MEQNESWDSEKQYNKEDEEKNLSKELLNPIEKKPKPKCSSNSQDCPKKLETLKRSFDVAFLTGNHDDENDEPKKSAFSKVIKRKQPLEISEEDDDYHSNNNDRKLIDKIDASVATTQSSPRALIPQSNQPQSLDNPFTALQSQSAALIRAASCQNTVISPLFGLPVLQKLIQHQSSGTDSSTDVSKTNQHKSTNSNMNISPMNFVTNTLAIGGGISNTCAKCGITFRMTSDLVYHMRTHHTKGEKETNRERKKEIEKLKCLVCGENFKERHHLTRHMTAHQGNRKDDLPHIY